MGCALLFFCPHLLLLCSLCHSLKSTLPFSSLLFLWQEVLTIAGQSVRPLQEATGTSLAESECSAPAGICQQLANKGYCSPPQSLHYINGKLEVKKLEYSNHWGCLWSGQIEKNAWLTTAVNWVSLSGVIRSSAGPKVPLVTTQKPDGESLSTIGVILKERQSGSRQVVW